LLLDHCGAYGHYGGVDSCELVSRACLHGYDTLLKIHGDCLSGDGRECPDAKWHQSIGIDIITII
jgi:hypothetical protein